MKKFKVSAVLIYFFSLLVILLLYINFVYLPLQNKTLQLNTEHQTDIAQIATYDTYLNNLDANKNKIDELNQKLKQLSEQAPLQAVEIDEDISQSIKSSQIQMKSISMGDVQTVAGGKVSSKGNPLQSVQITMNFTCTSTQLDSLLNYYEVKSTAAYYINNVNLSSAEGNKNLSVTLSMAAYYYEK